MVKKPAKVNKVQAVNYSNIKNKIDTLTKRMEMMMKIQAQIIPLLTSCE